MPLFQDANGTTINDGIFNDVAGNQTINRNTTGNQFIFNVNYDRDIIMDNPPRGIVHNLDERTLSHLPLEQVHIDVFVVEGNVTPIKLKLRCVLTFTTVSARVTLRQTFVNSSEIATGHAKYVFPVPARAAVCAFEMHFADGRIITGVSKEKVLAAKEHENAIRAGKASGLVDWVTDDSSLRNCPTTIDANCQTSVHHLGWVYSRKGDSNHEPRVRHGSYGR